MARKQKKTESSWFWTAPKQKAARLLAEDELTDLEISDLVGIVRATLWKWKQFPEFTNEIRRIALEIGDLAKRYSLTRKARRLANMDRRYRALHKVIDERAADPEMAEAPGGTTGTLARVRKSLGSGDNQVIVTEFVVDVGLLKEIRELEKQAAEEVGDSGNADDEPDFQREED